MEQTLIVIPETRQAKDENQKEYTEFIFQIQMGDDIWSVAHRYSKIHEFHFGLKARFPKQYFPEFPPKGLFMKNEDVEDRRKKLQQYFQEISSIPTIANSWEYQYFLEIRKHRPPTIKRKLIMPLPDEDFDPSEASIPWKLISSEGFDVHFATKNGKVPKADQFVLNPIDFVTRQLAADAEAKSFYQEMERDNNFNRPMKWSEIEPSEYDGMILPGGHAPGMKQYLEDQDLQMIISKFWSLKRPLGAICHGVLLLARCKDTLGTPIIHDRKVITLPKYMEEAAYLITKWKYGLRYRTYPEIYCEDDVRRYLDRAPNLVIGPTNTKKGTAFDDSSAFIVEDGNLITARWPGDAYLFAKRMIDKLYEMKI